MTPPPIVEVLLVVGSASLAAWAVTYLIHSTLTIAAAWMLTRFRSLAPVDEVRVWQFAVLAPVGTAAVQAFVTGAWSPLAIEVADTVPAQWVDWRIGAALFASLVTVPAIVARMGMAGRRQLSRTLGTRVPAPNHVQRQAAELAAVAGRPAPRVTMSATIAVPAAVGLAEICVPEASFGLLPAEQQRALLAHELGHLAKRDPVCLAILNALARLVIVQPLNRVAVGRMRAACERAADDFAIRVTGDPVALARALSSLTAAILILSGGASAAGSPIVERVQRILDARRSVNRSRARLVWAAGALAALVWLAPGAAITPERVANRLPWLAPSHEAPGPRLHAVRRFEREWRETFRRSFR